MGGESWSIPAKQCDSCKSATAKLFCRADAAFLCVGCDAKVHAANKLASRHARVWMCEVCEQAPASVTCKADAAALCVTCDRDIHSANPLASRHERFPVTPFYEPAAAVSAAAKSSTFHGGGDDRYFSDLDGGEAEEAEAASWLLPNPNPKVIENPDFKSTDSLFSDIGPYLDIDIMEGDQKPHQDQQHSSAADGVVPVQSKNLQQQRPQPPALVDGVPCYNVDYSGSKPFLYNFNSQSLSQSVSSSSLEVGVVPDHNSMADVSTATFGHRNNAADTNPGAGIDREARVMRYREKRKNRKFEKTIRYASRKAYAETRPRIKGRFAKRSEPQLDGIYNSSPALMAADVGYGVVPSF